MSFLNKIRGKLSREEQDKLRNLTDVEDILKSSNKDNVVDFQKWLQQVHDMSKQELTREEKRKKLCEYLNELNEDVYIVNFPHIVAIIQKSKDNCKPFKNSREQVDDILSWLPRLKDHEELLLLYIQERRKKYGLEV
jgi:hypothetical protein